MAPVREGAKQIIPRGQLGSSLRRSKLAQKQTRDWLRADLERYAQLVDKGPDQARTFVQQRLQFWQKDADFTSVRGDALTKLPEAERDAWRKLWADLDALRKRAAESK